MGWLLQWGCHWGVAALLFEEAYVNILDHQVMALAVPLLGKTFDHIASALAGDALWSFVCDPALEMLWNLFSSRPESSP